MNNITPDDLVNEVVTGLAAAGSPTILMHLKNYDDDLEDGMCIITLTDDLLRRLHHYAGLVRQFCEEHGANYVEFNFADGLEHLARQPESLADYDLWREEWLLTSEPYDIRHNPTHNAESVELSHAMHNPALRVYHNGAMVFCSYHRWLGFECETDLITSATLDAWATLLAER
ncbi:MAG: hypothetical protein KJ069_29015 [Anaerolineae bacterium]|nr:hypothetical protein [Anaerolineae bacterium]